MPDLRSRNATTGLNQSHFSVESQPQSHAKDFINSSFTSLDAPDTHTLKQETSTSERILPGTFNDSFQANHRIRAMANKSQTAGLGNVPDGPSTNLSGLVCNVQRTSGQEPAGLVGASTTIVGDKLYVFGGRRISSRRSHLTNNLFELDLVRRHWTRLEVNGSIPLPRYFHSMCALGDTKLVCYGGMAPSQTQRNVTAETSQVDPGTTVMSDIHVFDILTSTWTSIPTKESPPGRYAHCAAILPSSAVFTSNKAPLSAIQNNPSSSNPNEGIIGVSIDGRGGAELVIVGGQDASNRYIEQISVFNLRSLQWTTPTAFGRSCGAYRSVVAPLSTMSAAQVGSTDTNPSVAQGEDDDDDDMNAASSLLIYSNFNFLDVKLELQIRSPDGSLTEKSMGGTTGPPGLRFPNGGILAKHFVVSGTYMTSTRQEYMLWALNLHTLTWSRIDVGGGTFSAGSWNRGLLWNRKNCFVVLGHKRRSLAEDYNQRRLNFSHVCLVEMEAFGLYENTNPLLPCRGPIGPLQKGIGVEGFELLGRAAWNAREAADMDIVAIGGERIPVNSNIVAHRWGPYFVHLVKQGEKTQEADSDASTLQVPGVGSSVRSRNSGITITPSIRTAVSDTSTVVPSTDTASGVSQSVNSQNAVDGSLPLGSQLHTGSARSRLLFLPHTHLTVRALVYYFYTSSLPPSNTPLCTPQILCSMLQLARPYRINGLLEATVERLHQMLDARNTAAIFNAAAMAAGKGDSIRFVGDFLSAASSSEPSISSSKRRAAEKRATTDPADSSEEDETSGSTSVSTTDVSDMESSREDLSKAAPRRAQWRGEISAVVGLQKRGLRGLMEGRRLRERTKSDEDTTAGGGGDGGGASEGQGVGLGIG